MLGFSALLVPQCDHIGLTAMIPHIIRCVFENVEVELDMDKCIDSMPSNNKIYTLVTKSAVDTII